MAPSLAPPSNSSNPSDKSICGSNTTPSKLRPPQQKLTSNTVPMVDITMTSENSTHQIDTKHRSSLQVDGDRMVKTYKMVNSANINRASQQNNMVRRPPITKSAVRKSAIEASQQSQAKGSLLKVNTINGNNSSIRIQEMERIMEDFRQRLEAQSAKESSSEALFLERIAAKDAVIDQLEKRITATSESTTVVLRQMEQQLLSYRNTIASREEIISSRDESIKRLERELESTLSRVNSLDQVNKNFQSKLEINSVDIENLNRSLKVAEETIQRSEAAVLDAAAKTASIEHLLNKKDVEIKQLKIDKDLEIERLNNSNNANIQRMTSNHKIIEESNQQTIKMLRSDLEQKNGEIELLRSSITTSTARIIETEAILQGFKQKTHSVELTLSEALDKCGYLEQHLLKSNQIITDQEKIIQEKEKLRRVLHNTVQELRGNIRVFCRIRPPSGNESSEAFQIAPSGSYREELHLSQAVESATGDKSKKNIVFSFDRIFGPDCEQAKVFSEIEQLVQSALDGYRVCIFAYGQTGSGKTFTMEGETSSSDKINAGMIPRAVQQIFESVGNLETKGWSFTLVASYLEIYNETIRDLLADAPIDPDGGTRKYDIRHISDNKSSTTVVSDLTLFQVTLPEQVNSLLYRAASNRSVGGTNCNERSSRSHAVFTFDIRGTNNTTGESISGLLNLIDLAGSERLTSSGATGDRLRETQAINKSLSALSDVIHSLAAKEAHIPYRNSKLTYLLQNSLGGDCKTLMFVNVSPATASLNETICSLRFAAKVNACQIGSATRKVSLT